MRNIALFLAAAGLGAATALAGPAAAQIPASEIGVVCDQLNYRFQFDFKHRQDFPRAGAARALHRSGVEKCQSGRSGWNPSSFDAQSLRRRSRAVFRRKRLQPVDQIEGFLRRQRVGVDGFQLFLGGACPDDGRGLCR